MSGNTSQFSNRAVFWIGAADAEESSPSRPAAVAKPFAVRVGDVRLVGSWTRVDVSPDGEVALHEYSSGEVRGAEAMTRRVREHRRLSLGALAWRASEGTLPDRLVLHMLGNGAQAETTPSPARLVKAETELTHTVAGITAREFAATPSSMVCRRCAFVAICPDSAVPSAG